MLNSEIESKLKTAEQLKDLVYGLQALEDYFRGGDLEIYLYWMWKEAEKMDDRAHEEIVSNMKKIETIWA